MPRVLREQGLRPGGPWKGHRGGLELDRKERGGFRKEGEGRGIFSSWLRAQEGRQRRGLPKVRGEPFGGDTRKRCRHITPAGTVLLRLPVSPSQHPSEARVGIVPILVHSHTARGAGPGVVAVGEHCLGGCSEPRVQGPWQWEPKKWGKTDLS